MSLTFEVVLIAIVFASQIGVLSFLTPYLRRRNHALMFTRYPPANYPRLYPVPKEQMERKLELFKPVHFVIGIGAAGTMVAGLGYAEGPFQFARWMFYCLLLQVLPMYIMMPWMIKVSRAFKAMPPPSVRSAEFRQWRVGDFVSPLWISLGLASSVLALVCATVTYMQRPETLLLVVFGSLVSAALLLRMIYVLLGRVTLVRPDPYMSQEDMFRARQRRLRLLFRGSTLMCTYIGFMLLYSAELLRFDFAYVMAGVSLVFQLLGLGIASAQNHDLNTRDFSVYRDGVQATR